MAKPDRSIPIPGMDRKAWESDYVQFPRLLAEILAVGLTEEQKEDLRKSMDLEGLQLEEILIRADRKWQRILDSYKPQRGKRGKQKQAQFS